MQTHICTCALQTEGKRCRLGSPTTSFHIAWICGDIYNALHKCTTRTPRCRYTNQIYAQSFPGNHIHLCTSGHRQQDAFITQLWCDVSPCSQKRSLQTASFNHVHITRARAEDRCHRWRKRSRGWVAAGEQTCSGQTPETGSSLCSQLHQCLMQWDRGGSLSLTEVSKGVSLV